MSFLKVAAQFLQGVMKTRELSAILEEWKGSNIGLVMQ
jgi:hypothetical protein